MKILLIGCGYAGKRHAINIQEIGHSVSVYDTDPEVMAWTVQNKFEWVENLKGKYDGAVIATPPEFHMQNYDEIFEIMGKGKILIEKPLALTTDRPKKWKLEDLRETNIMMAHNYLFSPELWKFKREMIAPLRADRRWEYVSADYLPHWHGPDFANEYEDRHEARDGCMAISVSHAIYILDYLFGMPDREEYYKDNYSVIKTRGDNAVTGVRINKNSNVILIESWAAKGERQHYLKEIGARMGFNWINHTDDILASYKVMMKCFLDVVEGARDIPELCQLSEGIRIVKAIEDSQYLINEYE